MAHLPYADLFDVEAPVARDRPRAAAHQALAGARISQHARHSYQQVRGRRGLRWDSRDKRGCVAPVTEPLSDPYLKRRRGRHSPAASRHRAAYAVRITTNTAPSPGR
ncbi:hypothetical protein I6A84_10065 [Frankia sp. CNm7]|uniref:hypothetical protein n=1 Tax=Frankia nepalensis TaxID=1836974 RepID=UPI001934787D|nr:hypothetical protein [Frankia nepalensis]MBL7518446.1 hypothetical protein [Frankia nepalensis]